MALCPPSELWAPTFSPSFPLPLRLKKALKCHIPDPSKFFSQLSSEHGGDFQVGSEVEGSTGPA